MTIYSYAQVAMIMGVAEMRGICGWTQIFVSDTDVSTIKRKTGLSSENKPWVRRFIPARHNKITVPVALNVCLMLWSPHHLNAKNLFCCFCVGCQADNGCIKKGSEVSAQGCIRYICNKKGDLEILSVGKHRKSIYN